MCGLSHEHLRWTIYQKRITLTKKTKKNHTNILDGPSTKKESSRVRLRVESSSGNMTDVNVDLTWKLVHSSTVSLNRTIDSRNLMWKSFVSFVTCSMLCQEQQGVLDSKAWMHSTKHFVSSHALRGHYYTLYKCIFVWLWYSMLIAHWALLRTPRKS